MPYLYMDCAGGMSGDMFLAALSGIGLDLAPLESILRDGGIDVRLESRSEQRHGLAGHRVDVVPGVEQPLRHLAELEAALERLELSPWVRARAAGAFRRLAQAEARVHDMPLEKVHFHEVGAVDTLVDVAGAFWGLEVLGVERVVCAPVPWFRGTVECAHGCLPLPAPATTVLLEGKPIYPTDHEYELITPTGALLIDRLVDAFASGPEGTLQKHATGWGASGRTEGLRLFLYEPEVFVPEEHTETVYVLESHIDHLTGEDLGGVFEAAFEAGALDVLYLPGLMKKNRPGGLLTVLCRPEDLAPVQAAFFKHTLTLGIRRSRVERVVLERRETEIDTPFGKVRAKEFELDGKTHRSLEYDSLAELARETGRSVPELRMLLSGEFEGKQE
jgi:pyridinium-3,5-bisthiocarboxylic acid mononucleotide nickel chelatase